MTAAHKIVDNLSSFFLQAEQSAQAVQLLVEKVTKLEAEVIELKEHGGDDGWMTLKAAASRVGMTACALRQTKGLYPEGIVWKKNGTSKTSPIWFNLKELRKII